VQEMFVWGQMKCLGKVNLGPDKC